MQPELFSPAHDGSGGADYVSVIARMGNDLAAMRKNLATLLARNAEKKLCTGPNCGQEIYFIAHWADPKKRTPFNLDGSNHFITCPDRDLFRNRRRDAR